MKLKRTYRIRKDGFTVITSKADAEITPETFEQMEKIAEEVRKKHKEKKD